MVRLFLSIFVAVALAITVTYRESFFSAPDYDEGDDAANAFQIENAKHFRELHGNYSRWEFHHPGPAFFYVYALGEWLLHDVAHVTPQPHNAYRYAGLLLQLAFYAAAVALVARQTARPGIVVGLAFAAATLHFGHVERVFYSIWPPDVLLMPFLCFVVACAVFHAGDRLGLPFMVLGGGFLVHGHIVQPLFVVTMAVVAFAASIDFKLKRWRELVGDRYGVTALVLFGVFMLPMVIDAFGGRESNLHAILLHFKTHGGGGQTFLPSLLLYAAYYGGMPDLGWFDNPEANTSLRFAGHPGILALWLLLLAGAAWWFFRRVHRRNAARDLRFGRGLLGFWLLGSGLAVVWAMKQDGGFTHYNSHFNHSLAHILLLAAIVAVVRKVPAASPALWLAGAAATLSAMVLVLPVYARYDKLGGELVVRLPAILAADPNPRAPKLLKFSGDSWYEAITVARALQLQGIDTYVDSWSRTMYGSKRVLERQDILLRNTPTVWQIVPEAEAPRGAHVLVAGRSRVIFPPVATGALPLRFDFTKPVPDRPVLIGIGGTEDGFTWTVGRLAAIEFHSPETATPLTLGIEAFGAATRLTPKGQRVRVFVNGTPLGEHLFAPARQRVELNIPASVWNSRSPRLIALELPDAVAPVDVSSSGDRRQLALQLHGISVEPLLGR